MPGYYERPDVNAQTFHDGWMRTGDLAYMLDGELVICGRIKDVIIVAGRNVFPEDVERAVGEVDGVRAGNVITAFGVATERRAESLVLVAEVKADDHDAVRRAVAERCAGSWASPPRTSCWSPQAPCPRPARGKLQRLLCKARYEAGQLDARPRGRRPWPHLPAQLRPRRVGGRFVVPAARKRRRAGGEATLVRQAGVDLPQRSGAEGAKSEDTAPLDPLGGEPPRRQP